MIDITSITDGDLVLNESIAAKAANLFQVQLGALEYAPDFGVDLEFFLDPDLQFQNESFKAYLIQRLSENHVNVNEVLETVEAFSLQYTFTVGDQAASGGLIL